MNQLIPGSLETDLDLDGDDLTRNSQGESSVSRIECEWRDAFDVMNDAAGLLA